MQIEMVPLAALTVDMPLDPRNVETKVMSLRDEGLGQPIVLWKGPDGRYRIIDGLHRVEAAKRLGWEQIACVIRDVDEERFWSFRIQSARQHARITEDRLVKWISECWKATPWFNSFALDEAAQDALIAAANALWQFHLAKVEAAKQGRYDTYLLEDDTVPIFEWFSEKAQLWDMDLERVMGVIFGAHGLNAGAINRDYHVKRIAEERKMTVPELLNLADEVRTLPISDRRGEIPPEVANDYLDDKARPGESLIEYARRRRSEAEEAKWQAELEHERAAFERYRAQHAEEERAQVEAERRKAEQERVAKEEQERILRAQIEMQVRQEMQRRAEPASVRSAADVMRARIEEETERLLTYIIPRRESLRAMPDGQDVLLSVAARVIEIANDIWPERRVPAPRPVPLMVIPEDVIALSAKELA